MIEQSYGLKIKAILPGKRAKGIERYPGEEWLVREIGLYIPSTNE